MQEYQKGTQCLHAGYVPEGGEPRNIPIVQSTTFRYGSSEAMGALFDLEAEGYFYTRLQNPTSDRVAAKICALEGGTAAMLTSSGQAANFFAVFNICSAGDHVVASAAIYGGTFNLFAVTMKRMGIDFTFVDPNCSEEELNAAFQPNTKAVFGETIANPALIVLDIEKFARAAHAHGVPLIVDNTFATPVGCRPFQWGADIVTHSTTKYMDGHANCVGGAIVDSGNFDWTRYPDRYPGLCTPDESYHGVTYTERFGLGGAYITKATVQLMRDFGATPAPMNAYLLNVGLETLHLRMPQHCANALAVAKFVQKHPKIAWVNYPGLEGDKYHDLAQKYMPKGTCGVVTFGVKGGRKAAETFMAGLKLASIATHVADAKTCVLHPASSTHRQLSEAELAAAGVSADLIRLSHFMDRSDCHGVQKRRSYGGGRCPAAQHRRSLCEDDSLAAPVYQFLSELYLGGNSAGVCPVNPAQTPVDRGSGFRGAGRVRSHGPVYRCHQTDHGGQRGAAPVYRAHLCHSVQLGGLSGAAQAAGPGGLRLCVRRGVLLFPGQLGKRALPGGCDRRAGGDMLCLGLSAQQDSGGRPSVVYHPGTEHGGGNRSALVGAGDSV